MGPIAEVDPGMIEAVAEWRKKSGRPKDEARVLGNVYVEARPLGRHEGTLIEDYVVEDQKDHVLKVFKTQKEAIDWAKKEGHHPLVARVRDENNKTKPDHWRAA